MKNIFVTKKVDKKLRRIIQIISVVALMFSGSTSFSAAGPEWTSTPRGKARQATTAHAVFEKIKRNLIAQRAQSAQAYQSPPSPEQQDRKRVVEASNAQKIADLKRGNYPNRDKYGKTSLMQAAQTGDISQVKQNIREIEAFDHQNDSALRWAMNGPARNLYGIVDLLIKSDPNATARIINAQSTGTDWRTGQQSQRTPLQWLLRRHPNSMGKGASLLDKETVNAVTDQLLAAGADPLIQDKDEKTAIYWALALNDFDLALKLYNAPGVATQINPAIQQSFIEAVFTSNIHMTNYQNLVTNFTRLSREMGVVLDRRNLQQAAQAATTNIGISIPEINILVTDIMQQTGISAGQVAPARPYTPARPEKQPAKPGHSAASASPLSPETGIEDLTPEERVWLASEQQATQQREAHYREHIRAEEARKAALQAEEQAAPPAPGYPPRATTAGTGPAAHQVRGFTFAQSEQAGYQPARPKPTASVPQYRQPAAPAVNQAQIKIDTRISGLAKNIDDFFNQQDWNSQNFKAHYFRNLDAIWSDATAINYRPESLTKLRDRLVKYAAGRQRKKGLGASETKAIADALQMSNRWQ